MNVKLPLMLALVGVLAGCSAPDDTPRKDSAISFQNDIAPILSEHCVECHMPGGEGHEKSGLLLTGDDGTAVSYDSLMRGTRYGPVIVVGDAESSTLVRMVEGRVDPSIKMPHGKGNLPADQQAALRQWVEQGASNN
ncbi:MAG: hypothetical protein ABFS23_07135 [Pseudomonadota bacterium]